MLRDGRDAHRTRSSSRAATETPPAGTDHATPQARPAVEGDPGSGATPLRPLPGSAACFTCGQDTTLAALWLHHDRSSRRMWTGTPRPSCGPCAYDDAATITDHGLHGSRVIAVCLQPLATPGGAA